MNPFQSIWLTQLNRLLNGQTTLAVVNNASQLQTVNPAYINALFTLTPTDPTDANLQMTNLYNQMHGTNYGLGCIGGTFVDALFNAYLQMLQGNAVTPVAETKSSLTKYLGWIIAVIVILIFAVTSPKTLEAYRANPRYDKVNNYLLFSTCSEIYGDGHYEVKQIGILGMIIDVKK